MKGVWCLAFATIFGGALGYYSALSGLDPGLVIGRPMGAWNELFVGAGFGAVVGIFITHEFLAGFLIGEPRKRRVFIGATGGGAIGAIYGALTGILGGVLILGGLGWFIDDSASAEFAGAMGGAIIGCFMGLLLGAPAGSMIGAAVGAIAAAQNSPPTPSKRPKKAKQPRYVISPNRPSVAPSRAVVVEAWISSSSGRGRR